MILIKNKIVAQLLEKKDSEISKGRLLSKDIEKNNKRIEELKKIERDITEKVECKELIEEATALAGEIDKKYEILNELYEKVRAEKIKAIPDDVRKEHESLIETNKKIEKQRQRHGEAVQKIKEKVVPTIQKKVAPDLPSEFHDIGTAKLNKEGDVEVEIFSHIDEFKKKFRERTKQK